jgi:hypothetical protein
MIGQRDEGKRMPLRSTVLRIIALLFVAFLTLQFIRPKLTIPDGSRTAGRAQSAASAENFLLQLPLQRNPIILV